MAKFFAKSHIDAVISWIESDFARLPLIAQEMKEFIKKIWSADTFIETANAIYWLAYNASYLFLNRANDERVCMVNYEHLVNASSKTLIGVCGFLGMNYEVAMQSDIYSTSVNCDEAPCLLPELEQRCMET